MIPLLVARAKAVLFLDGLRDDNLNTQDAALVLLMAMAMLAAQQGTPKFIADFCETIGPAVNTLATEYAAEYDAADAAIEAHGKRRGAT